MTQLSEQLKQLMQDDSVPMSDAWGKFYDRLLAAEAQEPVYQVLGEGTWTDYSETQLQGLLKEKPSTLFRIAYAAPQPVAVPSPIKEHRLNSGPESDDYYVGYQSGWNECIAAMLNTEPVSQPYTLPQWIPCSERMPKKSERVLIFIDFGSDAVPPSIHDAQFTGSTFRRGNATVNVYPLEDGFGVTHWMPLPAAPQEPAK